jgi:hypothetical protein
VAAFERHSSRRGALHPQPYKINDLNGLAGFEGRPFRLAMLTACRKCAYLSAVASGVKAERAGITDVSGVRAVERQDGERPRRLALRKREKAAETAAFSEHSAR